MKRAVTLLLVSLALTGASDPSPFGAPPVSDEQLADMRGGLRLPNGIDVALAVQSDTVVNGQLVLRSVYRIDNGPAQLSVFVPKPGEATMVVTRGEGRGEGAPSISYDTQKGLVVTPSGIFGNPLVAISTGGAGAAGAVSTDGLQGVDTSNGAVATPAGIITVLPLDFGSRVRLQGDGLDASHFFGSALGSLTANSGSDRAIDTSTTISLDLRNAGPDVLGSSLLRVENLALESTALLLGR